MDNQESNSSPPNPQVVTTPKWVIIVLLLAFPPLAFYYMWEEKRYRIWFANLLIIVGSLTSFLGLIQILFVTPKLLELYKDFNTETPSSHSLLTYVLIILGIIELIFGFFLKNKLKNELTTKKAQGLAVGLLLISYLFGGYLQAQTVLSAVTPLYNLTSELDSTSPTLSPQKSKNSQHVSPSPTDIITNYAFTFTVPENWSVYTYPNYHSNSNFEFPNNGKVAISNANSNCNFYIGHDGFGRGGPSEILDNTDIAINGIKFNKRSWYLEKGSLPFFNYYFSDDPKVSDITIYTWTTDQDCINDITRILSSIVFE